MGGAQLLWDVTSVSELGVGAGRDGLTLSGISKTPDDAGEVMTRWLGFPAALDGYRAARFRGYLAETAIERQSDGQYRFRFRWEPSEDAKIPKKVTCRQGPQKKLALKLPGTHGKASAETKDGWHVSRQASKGDRKEVVAGLETLLSDADEVILVRGKEAAHVEAVALTNVKPLSVRPVSSWKRPGLPEAESWEAGFKKQFGKVARQASVRDQEFGKQIERRLADLDRQRAFLRELDAVEVAQRPLRKLGRCTFGPFRGVLATLAGFSFKPGLVTLRWKSGLTAAQKELAQCPGVSWEWSDVSGKTTAVVRAVASKQASAAGWSPGPVDLSKDWARSVLEGAPVQKLRRRVMVAQGSLGRVVGPTIDQWRQHRLSVGVQVTKLHAARLPEAPYVQMSLEGEGEAHLLFRAIAPRRDQRQRQFESIEVADGTFTIKMGFRLGEF